MTTKVTIDAHAGWPVEVTTVDHGDGDTLETTVIVPAHTVQEFYVHSTRDLHIRELPTA